MQREQQVGCFNQPETGGVVFKVRQKDHQELARQEGGTSCHHGNNPSGGKDLIRKLWEAPPAGVVGGETTGVGRGPDNEGWGHGMG